MINMAVLHDAAFGGDPKERIPIERDALAAIYRALSRKRDRRCRTAPLTAGDLA